MSGESYTRWQSGGASDDDEDEGVAGSGEAEGSSVTIVTKPRLRRAPQLTPSAQARVVVALVLLCMVCVALGIWIGWAWRTSYLYYHPLPVNLIVRAPQEDYNHSQPFLNHLQPNVIRRYMRKVYGTPNDLLAAYIEGTWRELGFETTTTTFTVDLSRPDPSRPNTVEIVYINGSRKTLNILPENLKKVPYYAYSPAGTASGSLVYGHYGSEANLNTLKSLNIEVKGSILLLRHGMLEAGTKVRNAEEAGAAGVILYPDPVDFQGDEKVGDEVHPNGTALPDDGVLSGTLTTTPGDPSTPHLPSLPYVYRNKRSAQSLPGIPVQSVSIATARHLQALMAGPDVPDGWSGGLTDNNYTLGGSWADDDTANITLTVNNVIKRKEITNIHATLPAADETRVVMVGCHYGPVRGEGHWAAGLGAMLALSDALATSHLPRGTQRKVVLSAWAEGEGGMIGSTEFAQLHSGWLESSVIAYLAMDSLVRGFGALQVSSSSTLREALREAAKQVMWPHEESGRSRIKECVSSSKLRTSGGKAQDPCSVTPVIDVRTGWRLSDPAGMSDVYFHNIGFGGDFASFTAQRGVPSAHFATVGSNWKATYALRDTQYDDYNAYISLLDPTLEWTRMITSLVGATMLVLSESEIPPLVMRELSGDLYNGWEEFINRHAIHFNQSEYDFTNILDAIHHEILVLEDTLTVLDKWYKDRPFYVKAYPQHYPGEDHWREVEQRLWWFGNLEKGMLGPRGVERKFGTHLMLGPDPENSAHPRHFPHVVAAIHRALQGKATWEVVHQELSYVLAALASYRQLFPGDLSGSEI